MRKKKQNKGRKENTNGIERENGEHQKDKKIYKGRKKIRHYGRK